MCWDSDRGWGGEGTILFLGIALKVGTVLVIKELLKSVVVVTFSDFPDVNKVPGADSGDIIELSDDVGTPGQLTVTIALGPAIGDWKAVEIYDKMEAAPARPRSTANRAS